MAGSDTQKTVAWISFFGVVAAALITGIFAVMTNSNRQEIGQSTTSSPPTPQVSSTSASPPSKALKPTRVPDEYVGSWSGTMQEQFGVGYKSVIALDSTPDSSGFVGTETVDSGPAGTCSASLRLYQADSDAIVLEETSNEFPCLAFVYVSIKRPVDGEIQVVESQSLGGAAVATSAPTLRKT